MDVGAAPKVLGCFVFSLVFLSTVRGNFNYGNNFALPSELACEGYPIVMRCPGTDVIQVVSATYGRQNSETCASTAEKSRDTNCQLLQALDITSSKCNNKTQCKLSVSSENFPDPCPGTHKYLEVHFKCVKYMFGCPGSLNGIGSNTSIAVEMSPEAGSWSKDPLYNTETIFFVPKSKQIVQQYSNMNNFVSGEEPARLHALPFQIEGTSYVLYDGFMYYIKARSRSIIKYSFIAQMRTKEGNLPGFYSTNGPDYLNKVQLAVDEKGLWAIYVGTSTEHMDISRINMNTLRVEQTWTTTYSQSESLHSFVICGILYVIGTSSGKVDYMYDTNELSGMGKYISIGFDQSGPFSSSSHLARNGRRKSGLSQRRLFHSPAGIQSSPRSFRSYNFSSVLYNPRDRLLYAWEASTSGAVYYNLHFDPPIHAQGSTSTSGSSTTTSIKTTTISSHQQKSTTISNLPPQHCPPLYHSGISWSQTPVERYAVVRCSTDSERHVRWFCYINNTTGKSQWDPQGPDFSDCDQTLNDIEDSLNRGLIDAAIASIQLQRRVAVMSHTHRFTNREVQKISGLIRKVASAGLQREPPFNSTQGKKLADSTASSVDAILLAEEAWANMGSKTRYQVTDDLVTSMEDVGYLLAHSLAGDRVPAVESVMKSEVALHALVEPRSRSEVKSPPSLVHNRVTLPTDDLALNKGVFSTAFVFYEKLAKLLNAPVTMEDPGDWRVDSGIVSVAIQTSGHHRQLKSPVKISMATNKAAGLPRKCAFWKYEKREGRGFWSADGCRVTSSNSSHTECSCDHVTSFAVVVNVAGASASAGHNKLALSVITIIGISISLICLLFSIITFSYFNNLQNDCNTIHKHLCVCLLMAESLFLFGIERTDNELACSIIAGFLHYTFLAAFMWMALEGFQLYVMLIDGLGSKSRWKWYYLVGYGIPLVIVGVSAAVDNSGYGTERSCWLKADTGFVWSFVGPVCAVILCNLVFLGITVTKMCRQSQIFGDLSKIQTIKAAVRGSAILVFLLGITWAFGILWISEGTVIMAYLFALFNAFQGLFIFFFHCLFQRKVRTEYRQFFSRFSCCVKESSNSYLTNSMSFSKKYPPSRYPPSNPGHTLADAQIQRMLGDSRTNPSHSATLSAQEYPPMAYRENHHSGFHQVGNNRSSSQLERAHASVNSSNSFTDPLHIVRNPSSEREVEDEYDHLQRHCHIHGSHLAGCLQINHPTGARRAPGDPPIPIPHPRSHTMNVVNPARSQQRSSEKEGIVPGWKGQKASTLANMQGREWDRSRNTDAPHNENTYLLPSKHFPGTNKMESKIQENPRLIESLHPTARQRRSMSSSGSDDPIVNDYSASSSADSKPPSINGSMNANSVGRGGPLTTPAHRWERSRCPMHHNEEHVERDENDLEVELLTEADTRSSAECLHLHPKLCNELQRDSAFCQSMQELGSSPMNFFSSNSSHSSQEHPQEVQRQWLHGSYDAPTSKPNNASYEVEPHRRSSDPYFTEKTRYTNHPNESRHLAMVNEGDTNDALRHRPMVTQSSHYSNQYNAQQGIDSSSRMMTCL